jgi:hypothetical protein
MFLLFSTTVSPVAARLVILRETDEVADIRGAKLIAIDAVTVMIGDDPYTLGLFDTAGKSIFRRLASFTIVGRDICGQGWHIIMATWRNEGFIWALSAFRSAIPDTRIRNS